MAYQDTNTARAPRIRWDYDMRLVLHMLFSDQELSAEERRSAFSNIFKRELKSFGFTGDVPYSNLKSQNLKSQYNINGKQWQKIHSPGTPKEERRKESYYRMKIRSLTKLKPAIPQRPQTVIDLTGSDEEALENAPVERAGASTAPASVRRSARSRAKRKSSEMRFSWETPEPDSSDDEIAVAQPPPKFQRQPELRPFLKYAKKPSPQVTKILQQALIQVSSKTVPPSARRPNAVIPYPRPSDQILGSEPLLLDPIQYAVSQQPTTQVSEKLAHPPMRGLLFRYWNDIPGQLHDTRAGHVSRKHSVHVPMGPSIAPRCDEIPWMEFTNHFDRPSKITWPSAFVSATDELFWGLRQLVRRTKDTSSMCLTVISTAKLDPKGYYHAKPYYDQLVKKFVFHNGADRYRGFHEHLIYEKIPAEAIVKVITASDLLRLVSEDPLLDNLLRLDMLKQPGNFKTTIRPQLRAMEVSLTPDIVRAIATLSNFLGVGALSPTEHLSHIVSNIVEGWALRLQRFGPEEWGRLAAIYAHSLAKAGEEMLRSSEMERLEFAFLDGVRWGSSCHFSAIQRPEFVRLMVRQARRIGLEDPVSLLEELRRDDRRAIREVEGNVGRLMGGRPARLSGGLKKRKGRRFEMREDEGHERMVDRESEEDIGGAGEDFGDVEMEMEMEEDDILYD